MLTSQMRAEKISSGRMTHSKRSDEMKGSGISCTSGDRNQKKVCKKGD